MVDDIVQKFRDGTLDVVKSLESIIALSKYLGTDRNDLLTDFCSKVEIFNVIYKAAERMYDSPTNSRSLCLIATLLLKNMGSFLQDMNQTYEDLNESLTPQNSKMDLVLFVEGLRLGERIAAKAIEKANKHEMVACIEVLRWMQTANFMLCDIEAEIQKVLCGGTYSSDIVVPSCRSVNAFKDMFNVYVNYIGKYDYFGSVYQLMRYYFQEISTTQTRNT